MQFLNWIFGQPPVPLESLNLADDKDCARARRSIEKTGGEEFFQQLNIRKAQHQGTRNTDYLRAIYFLRKGQPLAAKEALKEELRYFPQNQLATKLLAEVSKKHSSASHFEDEEFNELRNAIAPYTMLSSARLQSLFSLGKELCASDRPGQFVECGVAAGGSSALLASVISRHSRQPRCVFSFDTFEGMPEPSEHDVSNGISAQSTGWGTGTCSAPEKSLETICRNLGVQTFVKPVKGLFADTLPVWRERIGPIALLHMDGDWYSSTRDILENLFDQVVVGGKIQIDDYGCWDGCRRAVSEFELKRGLKFKLTRIDETGVWMTRE